MLTSPAIPVPPILYGGIERIVDGICEILSYDGHEIYLIGNQKSTCKWVKKIYAWPGKDALNFRDSISNMIFLNKVYKEVNPEIIHSFSRILFLFQVLINRKSKVIVTYQLPINIKSIKYANFLAQGKLEFTACAKHLYKNIQDKRHWNTIYNFTDVDFFIPGKHSRDYLVTLGRLEPIKGIYEAIQIALACDMPLIIAGNLSKEHPDYFPNSIEPYLNEKIVYIGEVDDSQKKTLLQGGIAFLFPILWEEPFGIVMAESLACGTPVIALNRGSVPEVIIDDYNGFICENIEEMALSVSKIQERHYTNARKSAEDNFSKKKIGQKYLDLYKKTLEK